MKKKETEGGSFYPVTHVYQLISDRVTNANILNDMTFLYLPLLSNLPQLISGLGAWIREYCKVFLFFSFSTAVRCNLPTEPQLCPKVFSLSDTSETLVLEGAQRTCLLEGQSSSTYSFLCGWAVTLFLESEALSYRSNEVVLSCFFFQSLTTAHDYSSGFKCRLTGKSVESFVLFLLATSLP